MHPNYKNLTETLKKYDIKPSTIRIKVLDYLLNNRVHPTIEQIYNSLINEMPTLSKTSIYNTIELFLEKGLVREVLSDQKESRIDIDTTLHGHFKCEKCGNIFDFLLEEPKTLYESLEGFVVKEKNVFYKGICKYCIK